MNKLYIHVGPHKTGTTLIQKFLLDNRETLFKSDLVYPKRFIKIFGHHLFRDALANKSLANEDIAFINDAQHDFLLSSEDFISLSKPSFAYLKKCFPKKDIIVIYSWRRASYKMYSIWQEVIKHGGVDTFYEYFFEHLAKPGQSQMLSPDLKLNMLSSVFGINKVKIIDYDHSLSNDSLINDFLGVIGVEPTQEFKSVSENPHAVNKSLDVQDVDIIRCLNDIFRREYNVTGSAVREQYLAVRNELSTGLIADIKDVILNYQSPVVIGGYFIDHRAEKILTEKYKNNIVNYKACLSPKKITVIKPNWLVDSGARNALYQLADIIKGKL